MRHKKDKAAKSKTDKKKSKKQKQSILNIFDEIIKLSTNRAIIIRKVEVVVASIVAFIVTYFLIDFIFDKNNFEGTISLLINVNIALFAIQIATFLLVFSPFKELQNRIKSRKLLYIQEIEKDKTIYNRDLYDSFNRVINKNNTIFQFNAFILIVLVVHFSISLFFGCTQIFGYKLRVVFLFSDFCAELFYFIQFLLALFSFFKSEKEELNDEILCERHYLEAKLKAVSSEKTEADFKDIVMRMEKTYIDKQ